MHWPRRAASRAERTCGQDQCEREEATDHPEDDPGDRHPLAAEPTLTQVDVGRARRPKRMAGRPLRHAKKKRMPSMRLAIALALLDRFQLPHGRIHSSVVGAGLGTVSSRPQAGHGSR